jgi:hypothetical protein
VAEPERAVTGDRGALLGHDQLSVSQYTQQPRGVEAVEEPLERTTPEDAADHRRSLQRPLRVASQQVDACGDQRLERVRNPIERI